LLDEMNDRLSKLNGLLDSEQSSSDKRLADALARRRKKKEELQQKFEEVHQQAEHKNNELGDRLVKIAQMESQENGEIENEIRPIKSAPIICSTGISRGKLKGVITATGPYGHL